MTKIADLFVRLFAAAALATSAYVHLDLATNYDHVPSHVVGQGTAFRVQAVLACVLAALVIFAPVFRRTVWAAVLVLLLASIAALLITRYTDVTWIPGVYPDRTWSPSPDKGEVLSAEIIGSLLAVSGIGLGRRGLVLRRAGATPA